MNKPDTSAYKSHGGIQRIYKAFGYSIKGFRAALCDEAAFRQECALAIILLPLAFWLGRTATEIFLLCATVALVLIVELLNSAIEALADAISLEFNSGLGKAKDLGSAAVLLCLVLAGGWWAYVLIDRLLS